ncbi:ankyrin repeat domain-containing protein [Minwuia sp.]|uniref:ankyrin repeat domain-containing protein n=1 Tax=Minwuia sp. TaxID=2493630 RepID=UPI003A91E045
MSRRLIPKFLAITENIGRGTVVSGAFHAVLLGGVIVAAPQLFGKTPDEAAIPITIQVFDGVYDVPEINVGEPTRDPEPEQPDNAVATVTPEPDKPAEIRKPEKAPDVAVPDVTPAAVAAAKLAERPDDSGPIPEPNKPGDVAMVYERGAPLSPAQERADRPAPAAVPQDGKAINAELRRLKALQAQARIEKRVAAGKENPEQLADAQKRLAALQKRMKRLSVAKAAAQLPRADRPKSASDPVPRALTGEKRTRLATAEPRQALARTVTPKQKPVPKADELPPPPLPKLSAADILKKSERREAKPEQMTEADRDRARKSLERFKKAADEGIKSAEMNVARSLDKGKGVEQDKKKATQILEKLARENYQPAQIELAKKLLTGDGVEKDKKRAYIMLKTAADDNNTVARRALKALNKELSVKDRQLAEKEAGRWRRFIEKQRAEKKLGTVKQRQLDDNLRVAVDKGNVQRIENLLRSGANPNAIDASGRDAIIAAAWRGREMVVEFLIDKGVDIDTIDLQGRTPLIWASINGYQSIVEDLLSEGADPNARDDSGLTPLMRAAWNGHHDVVLTLLRNGAMPAVTDADGKTALDRAREEDWQQVVQVLEGYPRAN